MERARPRPRPAATSRSLPPHIPRSDRGLRRGLCGEGMSSARPRSAAPTSTGSRPRRDRFVLEGGARYSWLGRATRRERRRCQPGRHALTEDGHGGGSPARLDMRRLHGVPKALAVRLIDARSKSHKQVLRGGARVNKQKTRHAKTQWLGVSSWCLCACSEACEQTNTKITKYMADHARE